MSSQFTVTVPTYTFVQFTGDIDAFLQGAGTWIVEPDSNMSGDPGSAYTPVT